MRKDNAVRPTVRPEVRAPRLSRRRLVRGAAGVAGAAAIAKSTTRITFAQDASPVATPTPEGKIPSPVEGVPDAWLRMPEPFQSYDGVPGSGGTVRSFQISYQPPPPGRDDNAYWQELEKRLGVTWEPILTPQPNYGEKSAALIASGDSPDLFYLNPGQNASQQYQAMAQGAFLDLTPYLTGSALQEYPNLAALDSYIWENVKFQGKIFGVPKPIYRNGNLPFYRGDWADNVGVGRPGDAQQVHDMLVGFSNSDPDGNGNQDTWGMGRYGSGWNTWDNNVAIYMFGVPNDWRVNDDGTLTYFIETDEYRQALDYLRQLYADGGYHPDAAGMTYSDAKNSFLSGTTGLHSEGFLSFFAPINGIGAKIQELTPSATIVAMIPPGPDTVVYNRAGYFGYTGIPSSVGDNEERIRELLRILDYLAPPFGSEERIFLDNGIEGVHHEVSETGARITNDRFQNESGGLTYLMSGPTVLYYPTEPELAAEVQDQALEAIKVGIDNPVLTLYSETQVDKSVELGQLGQDRVTAIVTGRESFDTLDDAIQQWQERGGNQIREELQQAMGEQ